MQAYLNLTLEMAEAITNSGQTEHWAEARVVVTLFEKQWQVGPKDDPHYVLVTFVRKFGATDASADRLCAQTGQVIVVLAKDHGKAPRYIFGKPLPDNDPMLRDVQRNRLLASIKQPQAFKRRRA